MTRCVRVLAKGHVTGVGFRYSCQREAARVGGLRGYVRNRDTRTVECVLQGEAGDVATMIAWLRHGPPSAHVSDVTTAELTPRDDLGTFRVSM